MSSDIVAIATSEGSASISVIKLSGDTILDKVKKLLKSVNIVPRYAHYKKIYSLSGDYIDEAIVIYFKAPYSFTGEDVIEIQCHGGSAITSYIVNELLKCDINLAIGGEFSKRAILNDKMSIDKAETINSMINASSESSVKELSRQLEGGLGSFVDKTREELLLVLSISEVIIDYADEVDEFVYDKLSLALNSLISRLSDTIFISEQRYLVGGFNVSIIGKPNVGKSSLLNNLVQKDRAIVSDIKGTTRDLVYDSIRYKGYIFNFIDTAGIHSSEDKIEQIGIKKSKRSVDDADIIIAMFDSSLPFSSEDVEILKLVKESGKRVIYTLNKSDLKSVVDKNHFNDILIHNINTKNLNRDLLDHLHKEAINLNHKGIVNNILLTSSRQIDIVKKSLNEVTNAKLTLESGELELFSFHINSGLKLIGELTKPADISEVFDNMFGNFCLGK